MDELLDIHHTFDLCVVGGGMAGLIAAMSAARHGARVALIQDRPVLGGNASSEIRMHICGAHGENLRETGLLEELLLENHYRNPQTNYSIWDSVLYGKAQYQENLELFLNCSVNACETDGSRIVSVRAWQLTTETRHTFDAALYADCSGDGVLAPLSGAEFRIGREARGDFDEAIAPVKGDRKTMGMSCLLQAREYPSPQTFIPPDWAYSFPRAEDLRGRGVDLRRTNFWWMEVGGEWDVLHDTETIREELLRIAFGVWDHIKNYAENREEFANWGLDWMGCLPGKRESRRYVGDHTMTQHDIEAEGRFEDIVAYGGWSMDDHFPAGFYHPEAGTIFHPAPSPYGICYRSLYSRNIDNLFCAGRCHSATHAAMSSTRVMATTSVMGQAVGAAAAIAAREKTTPRGVLDSHLEELQETLMDDDCYLPWRPRTVSEASQHARLAVTEGDDPEVLRNGVDRPVGDETNLWEGPLGSDITYVFDDPVPLHEMRIVFDSDLNRDGKAHRGPAKNMRHFHALDAEPWCSPETLVKTFRIEACSRAGYWDVVHAETNNYQRLVRVPLNREAAAIRLVPQTTWGAEQARLFSCEVR